MDSLNTSLHELDNIPIEYAPKIKSKLESLKPSHFFLCQDAHQGCVTDEGYFNLDEKVIEEAKFLEENSLDQKSSDKTECSENLNVNFLCESPKVDDELENSKTNEFETLSILSFLRRKSN